MNFLTHLHLADISNSHLAANVAGNYLQTPSAAWITAAPMAYRQGLWLSQEINQLCASHELTLELMASFPQQVSDIAADIMAIGFDHYLAFYWDEYHPQDLASFSAKAYESLASLEHLPQGQYRPETLIAQLETMRREDWLGSYATQQGIKQALTLRAKNHPHSAQFAAAFMVMDTMQIEIETAFRTFYPQLMAYTRIWRRNTPEQYLPE